MTTVRSQRITFVDRQVDLYELKWKTKCSKLAAKDCQTGECLQETWNRYLIVTFVWPHNPSNAIWYLELRQSYKALRDQLVLPSILSLSNLCQTDYALIVHAIKNQLPSWNTVSLALDGWTSTHKLAITSIISFFRDRNGALSEVQLAFNEVDHLFFSPFQSYLRMIGQRPTYCSKASGAFEICASSFSAYRWPCAWDYKR